MTTMTTSDATARPPGSPRPWGASVLLDARGIDRRRLASLAEVLQFLHGLVPAIGMTAHGKPLAERFGTPGSRMFGWTAVQLITTSHIALHACEGTGELYLDVTTCGPVSAREVAEFVRRYWGADDVRVHVRERDALPGLAVTFEDACT